MLSLKLICANANKAVRVGVARQTLTNLVEHGAD